MAQEALDFIMNNTYDLVILDYMMPVYSGLESLKKSGQLKKKDTSENSYVVCEKSAI